MEQTQTNPKDFPRRLTAEAVGTAFLLAAVVGSGIMGERLAGGNVQWRCSPTRCTRARR